MGANSSQYQESGESAYVYAGCVKIQNMPPLALVGIGIIIQTLISFLITLKPDEYIQYRSSTSLKELHTNKKHKNGTSIAGDQQTQQQITALKSDNDHSDDNDDEIELEPQLQSNNNHQQHPPNLARDSTQMSEIDEPTPYDIIHNKLKNSTFYKYLSISLIIWQIVTMLIIFILDIIKLIRFGKNTNYDHYTSWQEFKCLSAILFISSNSQTMAINLTSMMIVYGGSNIYQGWRYLNIYKKLWFIVVLFLFVFYLSFILVFTFPGFFAYIWVTVPAIAVGIWIPKLVCCGCKCFFQTLYDALNDETYEMIMAPIILIFIYSLLGLIMINVFSGWPYLESFTLVWTERVWDTYFNGLGDSFEDVIRFITVFFG